MFAWSALREPILKFMVHGTYRQRAEQGDARDAGAPVHFQSASLGPRTARRLWRRPSRPQSRANCWVSYCQKLPSWRWSPALREAQLTVLRGSGISERLTEADGLAFVDGQYCRSYRQPHS
jgi:hypothetical protein